MIKISVQKQLKTKKFLHQILLIFGHLHGMMRIYDPGNCRRNLGKIVLFFQSVIVWCSYALERGVYVRLLGQLNLTSSLPMANNHYKKYLKVVVGSSESKAINTEYP